MGAQQSSEQRADGGADDAFVDYYTLLEVGQTATSDEIRRSYRKLALRLHPDKNPDNVEEANRRFTKLQEAYEVLSDDTERAWYDQNRERLMAGGDEEEDEEEVDAKYAFFRSGAPAPKPSSSAPGIGVAHLLRFFNPSLAKDLGDSDSSFFGTYRRLFARIAEEDSIAAPYPGEEHAGEFAAPERDEMSTYPSFGYADTPYVGGSAPVREFYQFWTHFSSRKSFAWKDLHDLRAAQDRRVKRLMEKDNRRSRAEARREYNDTIRSLALFVRKRDPRFKAYQAAQAAQAAAGANEAQAEERRREQAARYHEAKRAQAASFQAQDWQQAEAEGFDSDFASGESYSAAQDSEGEEGSGGEDDPMWDCVACNKVFQSQAAWENHERSKKHKKEVHRLQKEMRAEERELAKQAAANGGADTHTDEQLAAETQGLDLDEQDADVADEDEEAPAADKAGDEDDLADEEALLSGEEEEEVLETAPRSKKDKKKKKQERKRRMAMEERDAPPVQPASPTAPPPHGPLNPLYEKLPHLASLPRLTTRPPGSFDVFGYGSLLFKPPPHVIGYTPGFVKGFVRRFAQSSTDHRGTPERPGRVVTLVSSQTWRSYDLADEAPEGDIVWGISYTVDPEHADEVRAYLDHREKNGYSALWEPIYGVEHDGDSAHEVVLIPRVLVYVGLPDNEAFVGPEPHDALAERICTCSGPSGPNHGYLLRLAEAVKLLTPDSVDNHLFSLEDKVLALRAALDAPPAPQETGGRKPRRAAKGGGGSGPEKCNMCGERFPSRSKLFSHVREKGHAIMEAPSRKQGKKKK